MATYTGSIEVTRSNYAVRIGYIVESSSSGWMAYINAVDVKMVNATGTYSVNLWGGLKINNTAVGVEFTSENRSVQGANYSNYFAGASQKVKVADLGVGTVGFNISFYKIGTYGSSDQMYLYGRSGSTVRQTGLPESPNSGVNVSVSISAYTLSKMQGAHTTLNVKRSGSELANGATIYDGDSLTITFTPASGYKASCTLNGVNITSGYIWSVDGNAAIVSVAKALGFAYIADGANSPYQVYIDNGSAIELYRAYIDNGTEIIPY